MLEQVGGLLEEVGQLVRSCHERWDGAGYPDRTGRDEIPLGARVCACLRRLQRHDDRPQLPGGALASSTVAELRRCAGTQFDPAVVAALIAVLGTEQPAVLAPAA